MPKLRWAVGAARYCELGGHHMFFKGSLYRFCSSERVSKMDRGPAQRVNRLRSSNTLLTM